MFVTLLIKELHETLVTRRFAISSLLLIVLIPIGIVVSLDDYRQRLAGYHEAVAAYEQESEDTVERWSHIEGFRPPSPLAVFVSGIEPVMPNKTVTKSFSDLIGGRLASAGMVELENDTTLDNPMSALFGKMDYLFNVSIVLSILAFVFTYAGIAGEKEQGTLRQIIANPVDRGSVLMAKIVAGFLLLVVPFVAATLIGVIILSLSGTFPLTDAVVLTGVLAICGVSMLFLFCMFALGTLMSTFCTRSLNAIMSSLFVWICIALVIPRVSPMIARQLHPITPKEIVNRRIETIREDFDSELRAMHYDSEKQVVASFGLTMSEYGHFSFVDGVYKRALPQGTVDTIEGEISRLMEPHTREYAERLAAEIARQWNTYENEYTIQQGLAIQLSRISPVSCLTYILTAVASTGPCELERFTDEAERYQDEFLATVARADEANPDSELSLPVLHMSDYRFATLADAFGESWPDLLLQALYTVLFFAGAFVKFIRYDVR